MEPFQWQRKPGQESAIMEMDSGNQVPQTHAALRTVPLHEIQQHQNSTKLLLKKLPFQRLLQEVAADCRVGFLLAYTTLFITDIDSDQADSQFCSDTLKALQQAAKTYIVSIFQDLQAIAIHLKRVTLMDGDMPVLQRLLQDDNPPAFQFQISSYHEINNLPCCIVAFDKHSVFVYASLYFYFVSTSRFLSIYISISAGNPAYLLVPYPTTPGNTSLS
jgi:histone H3/H4